MAKTYEDWVAEIEKDSQKFREMPDDMKTPELCLQVARLRLKMQAYETWPEFPESVKTQKFFEDLVNLNPNYLAFVPNEKKTVSMCNRAIETLEWGMSYVPESMMTPDMCMKAVKQFGRCISFIPEDMLTLKLCYEAVKQDGMAFYSIPKNMREKVDEMIAQEKDCPRP